MSTIWWASRVDYVNTIEANVEWSERIKKSLAERGLTNVDLELRADETYGDLSHISDQSFDCIIIDGHARDRVARDSLRLLKRPGIIYLDNTDFAAQWTESYGEAERILKQQALENDGEMTYFSGFPPATFQTNQGLLIKLA